jgi:hypothetical protein
VPNYNGSKDYSSRDFRKEFIKVKELNLHYDEETGTYFDVKEFIEELLEEVDTLRLTIDVKNGDIPEENSDVK